MAQTNPTGGNRKAKTIVRTSSTLICRGTGASALAGATPPIAEAVGPGASPASAKPVGSAAPHWKQDSRRAEFAAPQAGQFVIRIAALPYTTIQAPAWDLLSSGPAPVCARPDTHPAARTAPTATATPASQT
jgi:hypothetical protein